MIVHWYIGFVGDFEGRPKRWHDFFTHKQFRHVFAMGFEPRLNCYVVYEPHTFGTTIEVIPADDQTISQLIFTISQCGHWLKVKAQPGQFFFGQPWLSCVTAIKHLVGLRSCALRPKGLYRDLVRAGAQKVFERENHGEK